MSVLQRKNKLNKTVLEQIYKNEKEALSLSANCMLAGLQLLLSLFLPAEVLSRPVSAPRAIVRAWKA